MRKQKHYFRLISVISILVGIILPLTITSRPLDWKWFFYIMAMGIALVWVAYSIILFGCAFLVEGRRNRKELKMRKEEDPVYPEQEWEALSKITAKRFNDPGMGNHNWN